MKLHEITVFVLFQLVSGRVLACYIVNLEGIQRSTFITTFNSSALQFCGFGCGAKIRMIFFNSQLHSVLKQMLAGCLAAWLATIWSNDGTPRERFVSRCLEFMLFL